MGKKAPGSAAAATPGDAGGVGKACTPVCPLCSCDVTSNEESILGHCTVCREVSFHNPCLVEYLERCVRAEYREGGRMRNELTTVLITAQNKPQDLIASNGRPQKWKSLRTCPACHEGSIEAAEVVKVRKVVAPLPTPAPRQPRAKAAAAPATQALKPKPARQAQPAAAAMATPMRLRDRLAGGGGGGTTFAAEQARLEKQAAQEEAGAGAAARSRREAERLARLHEKCAEFDDQLAALLSADSAAADGDGDGGDGGDGGASPRIGPGAKGAWAGEADPPWWVAADGHGQLAMPSQLSHATSGAGGDAHGAKAHAGPPAWLATGANGNSTGADTRVGWQEAAAHKSAGWQSAAASAGAAWGGAASVAAGWPADAGTAGAAADGAASGVAWLPPQYEGRQEAPEEEIDELLGMLGIS